MAAVSDSDSGGGTEGKIRLLAGRNHIPYPAHPGPIGHGTPGPRAPRGKLTQETPAVRRAH